MAERVLFSQAGSSKIDLGCGDDVQGIGAADALDEQVEYLIRDRLLLYVFWSFGRKVGWHGRDVWSHAPCCDHVPVGILRTAELTPPSCFS
jgi:hypothetical protein